MEYRTFPQNAFQADVFNELYSCQEVIKDANYFLDESLSKDLVGICTHRGMQKSLCFSIKKGLVYDRQEDKVFKAKTMFQFSEAEPTNQMDDIFYYGLSFMDAFGSLITDFDSKPILRYVFVGDSGRRSNGADLCAVADIETHKYGERVCDMEYKGICHNHTSMFPFCQCTSHIHGCRTEYSQKIITPKIRIIMPLMEPLLKHETCLEVTSKDAEMLKIACEAFFKNPAKFDICHIVDCINLRLK